MSPSDEAASTLSDIPRAGRGRPGLVLRRITLGLVALVVAVAATGLLGVHSTSVAATRGAWTLTVEYAGVARAGLDVPLQITVQHTGGFADEIDLAINRDYLLLFEQQGFYPDASASTSLGDDVLLTFDAPPEGDTFVVDFDAYVQPAAQQGARGTVAVLDGTERLVQVEFRTALFP
ncbi:hypothetical protein ABLG96_20395 [Nakamurella sp. A5-74]|uniref:Cohesin domain-containing protein n=1 Tax=Nakamurella sp. A5-74 TaxID=3158264 RepID=A0AAU8DQN4_9ACTN